MDINAKIDKLEARMNARFDKLSADVANATSHDKIIELRNNQIRDLQKDSRKNSEELIRLKFALENMVSAQQS